MSLAVRPADTSTLSTQQDAIELESLTKSIDVDDITATTDNFDTETVTMDSHGRREDEPLLNGSLARGAVMASDADEGKYAPSKREKLIAYLCFLILGVSDPCIPMFEYTSNASKRRQPSCCRGTQKFWIL